MSGGSYDYVYFKISDIELRRSPNAEAQRLREAFQEHLKLVAEAMHDIEWVDSCDYGEGDEIKAIQAVFDHRLPNEGETK